MDQRGSQWVVPSLNQIINPVTPMMMVPQTTAQYSIFSA